MKIKKMHFIRFELLVMLAVMRNNKNAYGISIREDIGKFANMPTVGALYTTLNRLVKKGMLSKQTRQPTPTRGGRAKTYFALTKKGQRITQASLEIIAKASKKVRKNEP
ncbi:MAG: helix-turn-helix transcriptional regulator [Patescibacteria group bacterium]|jgi:DNA-binding PadR family transcriptional regulator